MSLGGLARTLIQAQMLKEDTALHATVMAEKQNLPFVSYLIKEHLLDSRVLASYCAHEFGLPLFDLNALNLDQIPKTFIKPEIVTLHHALPLFQQGNHLLVAISDPTNVKALDEIKYHSNLTTEAILVEEHKFKAISAKVLSVSLAASLSALEEESVGSVHRNDINSMNTEKDFEVKIKEFNAKDTSLMRDNSRDASLMRDNSRLRDTFMGPDTSMERDTFQGSGISGRNAAMPRDTIMVRNTSIMPDTSMVHETSAIRDTTIHDAPIIRYVNKLLLEAVNSGVSDLHFEPYEKVYRIRFRQDGILYENARPPISLGPRLSARLKIMANLDISERRLPQDGRFTMTIAHQRVIDFRVSTCPTLYGEKVVMRVLDPLNTKLDLDTLGLEDFQKQLFSKIIHHPQGLLLVTGPTGSGKTVTLYTALNILNKIHRNISSCEDPVEINLPGINQVNINVKSGLTFAFALRAFLRQDPDVIMVGEIRDLETAEIAVKAAQTGHMVFSTLHTNSAADTITRLMNMGIPAYHLATSVSLIVAQRLIRKLCNQCKMPITLPESLLLKTGFLIEEIPHLQIYISKGCEHCKDGYKERTAIYEMMPVSSEISNIIMSGGNAITLYKQAVKEGMWDLKRSGLNKVKWGITSLEEVNRVTKD